MAHCHPLEPIQLKAVETRFNKLTYIFGNGSITACVENGLDEGFQEKGIIAI